MKEIYHGFLLIKTVHFIHRILSFYLLVGKNQSKKRRDHKTTVLLAPSFYRCPDLLFPSLITDRPISSVNCYVHHFKGLKRPDLPLTTSIFTSQNQWRHWYCCLVLYAVYLYLSLVRTVYTHNARDNNQGTVFTRQMKFYRYEIIGNAVGNYFS